MTTIIVEHVSKTFDHDEGQVKAVDNFSIRIPSGEVLIILGPSGCGKSSLLRLIAGLHKPDSGAIYYDRDHLSDIPLKERGIGFVFQDGALMPHWESQQTIGFFLRLRQREYEVPERLRRIAKVTGIGIRQLMDRRPAQLSGGEKQRVSIARALARDLRVLLFDEPFANLDQQFRTEARLELKRLLHEFPVTTVYVTHDQHEAMALGDRIAVMREGRLEQAGTFSLLYNSPINLFVATFIGTPTINLFSGQVRHGQWYGENFGGYPIRSDLDDGTAVTMGIRPEYIELTPQPEDGTPAVVDSVTPYYSERYQLLEVHLGGEDWMLQLPLHPPIEKGTTIYCTLNPDGILYFDTRTGRRIG